MQRLSVTLATVALVLLGNLVVANQEVDQIAVGGHIKKPGLYDRVKDESLAALINRVGGIPASRAELEQYQSGEPILGIRINLYRDGKKRAFQIDPKSNDMWELLIMKYDAIQVARDEPIAGAEYPNTITLSKREVEQGGADQPATRSESKSDGSQKPQTESEVRPR